GGKEGFQTGIHQPARRHHCLPSADQGGPDADCGIGSSEGFAAGKSKRGAHRAGAISQGISDRERLRSAVRGASDAPSGGTLLGRSVRGRVVAWKREGRRRGARWREQRQTCLYGCCTGWERGGERELTANAVILSVVEGSRCQTFKVI